MSGPTPKPWSWWVADGVSLALLTWLYVGDLGDALAAKTAAVAAMRALPSPAFPSLALVVTFAAAVPAVVGVARRRGAEFKGYRLLPIAALVLLFIDFFAIFGQRPPLGTVEQVSLALHRLAQEAMAQASPVAVPEARVLDGLTASLGPPPYLVKGEPLTAWRLETRTGCQGAATERGEAVAGTIVYCVSADRSVAWLTAVGLPAGRVTGEPQVVARGGVPVAAVVTSRPPDEPEEAPEDGAPVPAEGAPRP